MSHIPVLLNETIDILSLKKGDRILDCTFGGGGHTRAILDFCDCYVCGLDRDPDAKARAEAVMEKYGNRFDFLSGKFSDISNLLEHCDKFDAVLFDFGISSFQVDEAERGFSFSKDALLDMRMSKDGISAYDVVNSFSETDLADIIWTYGDEPKSRKIASKIANARKIAPIKTTIQLAEIIRNAVGISSINKRHSKIDPATKSFQAIRIFVNDELKEINEALSQLPQILNEGARIATISFHSLEDRIVKNWAKSRSSCISSLNKTVIKANRDEIRKNPRSRSAILRGFVYTENRGGNLKYGGEIE